MHGEQEKVRDGREKYEWILCFILMKVGWMRGLIQRN